MARDDYLYLDESDPTRVTAMADDGSSISVRRSSRPKRDSFVGATMRLGGDKSIKEVMETLKNPRNGERPAKHSTKWYNKRPICPYGCGEEGELVEVVMKDGKALGIYKDSEQLVFTADLQMAPKPTGRKIVIGPDGQQHLEEDV